MHFDTHWINLTSGSKSESIAGADEACNKNERKIWKSTNVYEVNITGIHCTMSMWKIDLVDVIVLKVKVLHYLRYMYLLIPCIIIKEQHTRIHQPMMCAFIYCFDFSTIGTIWTKPAFPVRDVTKQKHCIPNTLHATILCDSWVKHHWN